MTLICEICHYETVKVHNFRVHLNSFAHLAKCESKNACGKCLQTFRSKTACISHTRSCSIDLTPRMKKHSPAPAIASAPVTESIAASITGDNNIIVNGDINISNAGQLPEVVTTLKDILKDKDLRAVDRKYVKAMQKSKVDIFDQRYIDKADRFFDMYSRARSETEKNDKFDIETIHVIFDQVLLDPELRDCILYHECDSYDLVPDRVLYKSSKSLYKSDILLCFLKRTKTAKAGLIDFNLDYRGIDIEKYKRAWYNAITNICKSNDVSNRLHYCAQSEHLFGR